jgi:hypothetical protein
VWQEVAAAALVGAALSDSWLCLFMGSCFATADRRLGWGFLVGRTFGVLALLLVIGLTGAALLDHKAALVAVFGASSVGVAAVLAWSAVRPSLLGGCPEPRVVEVGPTGTALAPDGGCPGSCEGCDRVHGADGAHARTSTHDGGDDDGGCENVPRGMRGLLGSERPLLAGLALGAVRGATPCLKVLVLTPLLIVNPPATVVLMAVAYVATSSLYPTIGLLAGRTVRDAVGSRRWLRLAGAVGVAAVGAYTIFKYWATACDGLGG